MRPLPFVLLSLLSAACTAPAAAPGSARALNTHCPRSGKPVAADSLTTYRGVVVGFCNPHCRDDFAAHPGQCPDDRALFDRLLDERNMR